MMVEAIKVNVLPYEDGSGHKAELTIIEDGEKIKIVQGKDIVILARDEWQTTRDAIDKMFDALDGLQ